MHGPSWAILWANLTRVSPQGNGISGGIAGDDFSVEIQAKDIFFNDQTKAGDNFTVISFLGPQRYGEFYPQPLDADMTARDVYPMHSNWWLYFIGEDADTWNRTAVNRQTVLLTHSSVHTDLNNTCIIP